ncbi:MAG TPA: hypothetical protein VN442_14285 [Bryobacteraceae bacterium]|nr:hypothetical protein [Bryobacteraceae bacterium]
MTDTHGYWDITATPSLNLYADHCRKRDKPECRTCGQPFVTRATNTLDCGTCRRLTVKQRRELRARLGRA